jgi:hypothetical protein
LVYNKSFRKATDDEIRAFNEKNWEGRSKKRWRKNR